MTCREYLLDSRRRARTGSRRRPSRFPVKRQMAYSQQLQPVASNLATEETQAPRIRQDSPPRPRRGPITRKNTLVGYECGLSFHLRAPSDSGPNAEAGQGTRHRTASQSKSFERVATLQARPTDQASPFRRRRALSFQPAFSPHAGQAITLRAEGTQGCSGNRKTLRILRLPRLAFNQRNSPLLTERPQPRQNDLAQVAHTQNAALEFLQPSRPATRK